MIRVRDLKVREDFTKEELLLFACQKSRIFKEDVKDFRIVKKSIDARDKNDVFYVYTIDFLVENEEKYAHFEKITEMPNKDIKIEVKRKSALRPVVVGAGPAGLFAALTLAERGVKPIVLEQGKPVEERTKDVELFWKEGVLNTTSNVQFGEGGAGTFSDGKLTTGINDPLCQKVLEEFYHFGAPDSILYASKPHIGTDNLKNIVKNMREEIKRLGGEFFFEEKVIDFVIQEEKMTKVICESGRVIPTDAVILAIGHSAKDLFLKLYEKGANMKKKNFSVGVRIEHQQRMINESQYGTKTKLKLPPAEYKLVYHNDERACYTFCMCPGGVVVASSSEENTVVTNGMSNFLRDGENANSALLVNVTPDDFPGDSPLEGLYFREKLEKMAFEKGGKNYFAPVQLVGDFLSQTPSTQIGEVKPTYQPGITLCDLHDILPEFVSKTLEEGIQFFDTKIKGFAKEDAVLTAVETRSSSPVTIIRNENLESNIKGLYPCSEGAGYAGGIMTASVDGIKCAIALLQKE